MDAIARAMEGTMDGAILVSGDGNLVPLARSPIQHGVRVGVFFVGDESPPRSRGVNQRLVTAGERMHRFRRCRTPVT
jgi:uncharacterized LabA/DUF88 family protein